MNEFESLIKDIKRIKNCEMRTTLVIFKVATFFKEHESYFNENFTRN